MIIVTGAAGFIGSNIVAGLNARGITDILLVDDLQDGYKCLNLADLDFADYLEHDDFQAQLQGDCLRGPVEAVFHQGACSDTTQWDGRFMMARNFRDSKRLLAWCQAHQVPLIYASSAAVYGLDSRFVEQRQAERPMNMYAFSKLAFDQHVRARALSATASGAQVAGLRYFNVYGPREGHKGRMASVARHFTSQIAETGECRLFAGSDGYGDGEQRRDFIHVDDVVAVNLWLWDNPQVSGIFNCGTGQAQSFNEVADAVIAWHGQGQKCYIDFPESLRGHYQSYTQADMRALRQAGYHADFLPVETGVPRYLDWLASR